MLKEERRKYVPQIPDVMKNLAEVSFREDGEAFIEPEIHPYVPGLRTKKLVLYRSKTREHKKQRVGVLFSGGQAPGGHNVIWGLYRGLIELSTESELLGFLGGPSGLIEGKFKKITEGDIEKYRNTGGFDLLASGRTKIETPQQFEKAKQFCTHHELDGLVIIGGDDSNTNAALLASYFQKEGVKTSVIGVPKTIDGDLKGSGIEASFGFDTASKSYGEMIGNLGKDALSARKYYHFIKLMGRSASHIVLECALATHPNLAFISEEIEEKGISFDQIGEKIADVIIERSRQGKHFGLILIPEGIIEFTKDIQLLIKQAYALGNDLDKSKAFLSLPKAFQEQLLLDRDPHGNLQVSHIDTEKLLIDLTKMHLKNKGYVGPFNPVSHFFGYEGRSAYPSNFDANYCYALGKAAAALIGEARTGYIVTIQDLALSPFHWTIGAIPIASMMGIETRKGINVPVVKKSLVDLSKEAFLSFSKKRSSWELSDDYQSPGPIQFFGPENLVNKTTITLQLRS